MRASTGLVAAWLLVLPACGGGEEEPEDKLRVGPDERVELLAVVQHFTPWAGQRHTRFDFSYIDDIDQHFGDFSGHDAVLRSQQLIDSGFSYDAPPTFVLYHGPLPGFEQQVPYSDYLITRAGSRSNLEAFADLLRQFAQESDFTGFFGSQASFYDRVETDVRATMSDYDYVQLLEDYYGEQKQSFHVVPTPLFHAGGYGPQVDTGQGEAIYNICGPLSAEGDMPSFGDESAMLGILLHEFSHSFVNPVTEENRQAIAASASLFEPIREAMSNMAYNNWQTCVNEHLVRVNVARFTEILAGEAAKEEVLLAETLHGFIYIRDLDALMESYQADRARYPTYRDFYPEIVALFDSLASQE